MRKDLKPRVSDSGNTDAGISRRSQLHITQLHHDPPPSSYAFVPKYEYGTVAGEGARGVREGEEDAERTGDGLMTGEVDAEVSDRVLGDSV